MEEQTCDRTAELNCYTRGSGDVTWNLQKEHHNEADYDGSETGVSCEMSLTDKFLSLEQVDASVEHKSI